MGPGTSFKRVIPDTDEGESGSRVKRVILCSVKFIMTYMRKDDRDIKNIALVRLEQIYPFPIYLCGRKLSILVRKLYGVRSPKYGCVDIC